jgi:hypothetical protein
MSGREQGSHGHTQFMELDRGMWHRAATRVQWVARIAQLLWWGSMLVPLVAMVAFPGLLLEALLAAVVSLVFIRRIVCHLGARRAVSPLQALIRAGGLDLTRRQVGQLLQEGMAQGDGCVWVTIREGTHVRLIAEGREPGTPARSSSPWVWATGGGGM